MLRHTNKSETNHVPTQKIYKSSERVKKVPLIIVVQDLRTIEVDDFDENSKYKVIPLSPTDFVIDSMGFFTKQYFAVQENIDSKVETSKQLISGKLTSCRFFST